MASASTKNEDEYRITEVVNLEKSAHMPDRIFIASYPEPPSNDLAALPSNLSIERIQSFKLVDFKKSTGMSGQSATVTSLSLAPSSPVSIAQTSNSADYGFQDSDLATILAENGDPHEIFHREVENDKVEIMKEASVAAKEFTLFPKLPLEIHTMIWKEAHPGARLVHAECTSIARAHLLQECQKINQEGYLYGSSPIPALLHTCRESRQVLETCGYALSWGTRLSNNKDGWVWFNFDHDALYLFQVEQSLIPTSIRLFGEEWDLDNFSLRFDCKKLKFLAIHCESVYINGFFFSQIVWPFLMCFSALEKLCLVMEHCAKPSEIRFQLNNCIGNPWVILEMDKGPLSALQNQLSIASSSTAIDNAKIKEISSRKRKVVQGTWLIPEVKSVTVMPQSRLNATKKR
ncbi:hypothetical protein G7Y89_g12039 [Cudoniella acicularis]|uniref:2EXR domain-containing protein n=1 Tax=Cudoniella acicularis TaxID=354080 RepID=A0A8H4VXF0_9HELO|nr:hypothetical protein G7Y89_g12039 [Cudoniella acicularis]